VNDARFAGHPGCLETPKSDDLHEDRDNLQLLRSLLEPESSAAAAVRSAAGPRPQQLPVANAHSDLSRGPVRPSAAAGDRPRSGTKSKRAPKVPKLRRTARSKPLRRSPRRR
jgi:hypothetical protein